MRTLLVDNHDSYTYNVFHLLAAASGEEPVVVNNDAVSWRVLSRSDFDAIVLSPGPGRPERWHDFGVCRDILRYSEIPVLGICLGHQGIGNMLEGNVTSAPMPMHGRLSHVRHANTGIFEGIPQEFSVVRYHSLAIAGPPGPQGRVTAWADDGVVMGIEHTERPIWGVQFHPESIATEHGRAIAENFYALASRIRGLPPRENGGRRDESRPRPAEAGPPAASNGESPMRLRLREIEGEAPTEHLFERLFEGAENAFWLDSADAPTKLGQCSYLGTSAGRERALIEYDVEAGEASIRRARRNTVEHKSLFDLLDREVARHAVAPPPELERGLIGGFVGYLGYELKAECGAPNVHSSDMPDALLMLANRVVAVDHVRRRTYVCAVGREDDPEADAWVEAAAELAAAAIADPPDPEDSFQPLAPSGGANAGNDHGAHLEHVVFQSGRGRERYLADIAASQAELAAGESYEVCLTDQFSTTASPDPFTLYRHLRRSNPAPFAAYLKFGDRAVVSSSPERFLSVDRDRRVEARPIKGTISRHDDPVVDAARRDELKGDEKTMAEHLMIVDLLRNDVGRVCDVDSVSVPELMVIEPYATVHQMVSTIQGYLEPGRTPVECVHACFPGGSMTGAPKLRTMEIIDGLEDEARGVYSGAIGYFGLDGSTDLSIVIRTIVMRPGRTTIGAGGAIVMQSDPVDEFDEILLKARAPMAAVARVTTGREDPDAWSVELEPAAFVLGPEYRSQGRTQASARSVGAA
jgi:para-aminobenzoate synthetase